MKFHVGAPSFVSLLPESGRVPREIQNVGKLPNEVK